MPTNLQRCKTIKLTEVSGTLTSAGLTTASGNVVGGGTP